MFSGIWIGFEVENQYDKGIIPVNWWFSNKDGSQIIPIESKKYNKNDIIRVIFRGRFDKNLDKNKNITSLRWQYNFKSDKGDISIFVVDQYGNSKLIGKLVKNSRKYINCCIM